jgi:hypothetical protein
MSCRAALKDSAFFFLLFRRDALAVIWLLMAEGAREENEGAGGVGVVVVQFE